MRILIVDDHPIVASGCRALFAGKPEIVILEACDAESGEESPPPYRYLRASRYTAGFAHGRINHCGEGKEYGIKHCDR